MHLWSYDSLDHRAERRAALSQNERWRNEYLTVAGPLILRQDIRLMRPVRPLSDVEGEGHVYEYRFYRTKVGKALAWAEKISAVMPTREKYSQNVGLWISEAGQPNEVSHLWVYDSANARAEARAATAQDPGWQAFLKEAGPLLEEMHSTLLVPAPHSPRR